MKRKPAKTNSEITQQVEKEGKSIHVYEKQICSNEAVMSPKTAFSEESHHSSSEANVSHLNVYNARAYTGYNPSSVNESMDLSNYPNQEHFASDMSNKSPQNSFFGPQISSQSHNSINQRTFVKTEKLQNTSNKIISLEGDYSSKSDLSTQNFGYQQFSNTNNSPIMSTEATESPSENSKASEISRPCSVSNLSSEIYNNYDSPKTDPRYSPLSYQQSRYHPYVCPPQQAHQATNFSSFSHQEAHNTQANLNNYFGYNQHGQW